MSIVRDTPLVKAGKTDADAASNEVSAGIPSNACPAVTPTAVNHLSSPWNLADPTIDLSAGATDTTPPTPQSSTPDATAALLVAASATVAPLITNLNTKPPNIRLLRRHDRLAFACLNDQPLLIITLVSFLSLLWAKVPDSEMSSYTTKIALYVPTTLCPQ